MLMEIYASDIHNYMIKSSYNGVLDSVFDSVTKILIISDTTLR